MGKKLKSLAQGKSKSEGSQLSSAIKESAQQIWLAGLGAFAKAQEEGGKVFEALVREGSTLQGRSREFTEEKLGEVSGRVTRVAGDVAKQATQGWDKLEQVFEDRVGRALKRLGVPTNQEVKALISRVEQLNDSVAALGGKPARGAAKAGRATKAAAKAPAKAAKAGKATKAAKVTRAAKAPAAKAPAAKAQAAKAPRKAARKAAAPVAAASTPAADGAGAAE